MTHPIALTLQVVGHEDECVKGQLSDQEWATLQAYQDQHRELAESKPLREGMPCSMSLRWSMGTPLTVDTTLPDADTLSILLHRLRPFILTNEPASFIRVRSLLGKRIAHPGIRGLLRDQLRLFDGRKQQEVMQFAFNDVVVNSETALNTWLNSHEYHRDRDKRDAIDSLLESLPGDFARGIFVSMLVDKVHAICNVASLVHVLLTPGERLALPVPSDDSGMGTALAETKGR